MKILITGAAGFIGSALSKFWEEEELLLLDKNLAGLEKLADSLKIEPCLIPFDFEKAKDEDFSELAKLIKKDYGNLDVLIHLATPDFRLKNLIHSQGSDLDRFFKVLIRSPFLLTQRLLENLMASENPKVVFSFSKIENKAYWQGFALMQAALDKMLKDLAKENSAYDKIAWVKLNLSFFNSPFSQRIFAQSPKEFREISEILPKFKEIFNLHSGQLSELNF